jgi:Ribonuclease P 40kDa (Rpp40) subunit
MKVQFGIYSHRRNAKNDALPADATREERRQRRRDRRRFNLWKYIEQRIEFIEHISTLSFENNDENENENEKEKEEQIGWTMQLNGKQLASIVAAKRFSALAVGSDDMLSNCASIYANGRGLALSLDKDTYELLGLTGHVEKQCGVKACRYSVAVQFDDSGAKKNRKRERLEWALGESRVRPLHWLVRPTCDGEIEEKDNVDDVALLAELELTQCIAAPLEARRRTARLDGVRVPKLDALLGALKSAEQPTRATERPNLVDAWLEALDDWIGLALCNITRGPLEPVSEVTDYMSTMQLDPLEFYSTSASCASSSSSSTASPSLVIERCDGFLSPSRHVIRRIEALRSQLNATTRPYAIVHVSSYRNVPNLKHEHYTFVLFAQHFLLLSPS